MSMSGRDRATGNKNDARKTGMAGALSLMERALHIIDQYDGPADVGANLDLAISRLREWIKEQG